MNTTSPATAGKPFANTPDPLLQHTRADETPAVVIDEQLCTGCASCVRECFPGALHLEDVVARYSGACIECGHCVAVCPTAAVSMPHYDAKQIAPVPQNTPLISPNDLLETVKARRSIRAYRTRPLDQAVLDDFAEIVRYTPTARNLQGTRLVVVQDELPAFKELFWAELSRLIDQLNAQYPQFGRTFHGMLVRKETTGFDSLFFNAPAFLVVATDNPWDAGLAAQNLELMAVAHGAGVLHSGFTKRIIAESPALAAWLDLGETPVACCMLAGYPAVRFLRTAPRAEANVSLR